MPAAIHGAEVTRIVTAAPARLASAAGFPPSILSLGNPFRDHGVRFGEPLGDLNRRQIGPHRL
jgi:hypothetical protein